MSKTIAYEMPYPEVGSPMTDAVLCPECFRRLPVRSGNRANAEPLAEVSRTRYCDKCRLAIDPPERRTAVPHD